MISRIRQSMISRVLRRFEFIKNANPWQQLDMIRPHYKDPLPADRINNTTKVYDFISLGVGSGGSGATRRAQSYGAECVLVDKLKKNFKIS